MRIKFISLLIWVVLMPVFLSGLARAETSIYRRYYFPEVTNWGATTDNFDRLKVLNEYGVRNRFRSERWGTHLKVDVKIRASIMGLTDPPESWGLNIEFGKVFRVPYFGNRANISLGNDRLWNVSRGDPETEKGFGLHQTWIELEFLF